MRECNTETSRLKTVLQLQLRVTPQDKMLSSRISFLYRSAGLHADSHNIEKRTGKKIENTNWNCQRKLAENSRTCTKKLAEIFIISTDKLAENSKTLNELVESSRITKKLLEKK